MKPKFLSLVAFSGPEKQARQSLLRLNPPNWTMKFAVQFKAEDRTENKKDLNFLSYLCPKVIYVGTKNYVIQL